MRRPARDSVRLACLEPGRVFYFWIAETSTLTGILQGQRKFVTVRADSATLTKEPLVKLIIAIIQPAKLESVKEALTNVDVHRLTVIDCQGFGRQKGHTGVFRGHEFTVNLLRKVQLQIAVNEEFVQPTIDAILGGGRSGDSGEIGDGKIFVLPMDDCIRIRTGERGQEAI